MFAPELVRIEPHAVLHHRGQCSRCGRKSFRWAQWRYVEKWFAKHKCLETV
jgi:hypothetical protein